MIRPALYVYVSVATALLSLTACVSMEYGPIGDKNPYGYSEMKRAEGVYVLRVVHPSWSDAMAFWDKRAEELCGSKAYVKNIYKAIMPTTAYSNYGGMPGTPEVEGLLTCSGTSSQTTAAAPAPG